MAHWLEAAYDEGLQKVDVEALLAAQAVHITARGEWLQGVISPSLIATQCRLARLKVFMGHDPQPGLKWMAASRGKPSSISAVNMVRGFDIEGLVVTALKASLGDRILGHAPSLVFDALDGQGTRWAGHPDVLIQGNQNELELVQIKGPTVFKLDRIERQGDQDALETYLPQLATEMYIGRVLSGLPIMRSNLMVASLEVTPKFARPRAKVIPVEWDESLLTIPLERARETLSDYAHLLDHGQWPAALPANAWDVWPCSYCRFPRLGDFEVVACEENEEWAKHARGEPGRLQMQEVAVGEIPANQSAIIPLRRRRAGA